LISGALTNPLPSNTTVQGCGSGVSSILSMATSTPIFEINGASNITIVDIGLEYAGTPTPGASAILIAASAMAPAAYVRVIDVVISNAFNGVQVQSYPALGGTGVWGCSFVFCSGVSVSHGVVGSSGFTIGGGGKTANEYLFFTDCAVTGAIGCTASWNVQNAKSILLENCFSDGCNYGLYVDPVTTNDAVCDLRAANCKFLSSGIDGVHFTTGLQKQQISKISLTNCIITAAAQNGIGTSMYAATDALQSIWALSIANCTITQNVANGISLVGNINAQFTDAQIVGCNISENCSTMASAYGVFLKFADNVNISGCCISASARPPTSGDPQTQINGVHVDKNNSSNIEIDWTPEMFGAQGDKITDDTGAFVRALTSLGTAGGGNLHLRANATYMLNCLTQLPLEPPEDASIIGAGSGATIIKTGPNISTKSVFSIVKTNCTIKDLAIIANPVAGATPPPIAIVVNNDEFTVESVQFTAAQFLQVNALQCRVLSCSGSRSPWSNDNIPAIEVLSGTNLFVDACHFSGPIGAPAGIGIIFSGGSGHFLTDCDFQYFVNGLVLGAAGGPILNIKANSVTWDNCSEAGIKTTNTANYVKQVRFANCATNNAGAGGADGYGVSLESPGLVFGFQFANHQAVGNKTGINIKPAHGGSTSQVVFDNVLVANSSTAGIVVSAGNNMVALSQISFVGGKSGNLAPSTTQTVGLSIHTGSPKPTDITVIGLDVSTNAGASSGWVANPGGIVGVVIEKCLGYNPLAAAVPSPTLSAGTATYTNLSGMNVNAIITAGTNIVTISKIEAVPFSGFVISPGTFREVPLGVGQSIELSFSAGGATAPGWVWLAN
jgi:hypothetical protein